MSLVGKDELMGTEVEIHASGRDGTWRILVPSGSEEERPEQIGQGNTLEKAKAQARSWFNKRKVKVEVRFHSPTTGEAGVATGLHTRNRSVLVRYDNGDTEQVAFHQVVLRGDADPKRIEEMMLKRQQAQMLRREADKIEIEFKLSGTLGAHVERAIEAKLAEREAS